MNVLGIDTAGPVPGIALTTPHKEWMWSKRIVKGADAVLLDQLHQIVKEHSIDLVAVTTGPGSFTSLRVGVSIALGIALAKDIPVVPLSSLQVRAALWPHEYCLSLLDARRNNVYAQAFDSTVSVPTALTGATDVPLTEVLPKQRFIAVGEGAVVYRDKILRHGGFVPRDADRSPALMAAKMGIELVDTAVSPGDVSIQYIRGASAVPPKALGVPVGKPASMKLSSNN